LEFNVPVTLQLAHLYHVSQNNYTILFGH